MKKLLLTQTSSLNKTLINSDAVPYSISEMSCLKGEEVSYQIVYKPLFKTMNIIYIIILINT